jgi:hypothetical protein
LRFRWYRPLESASYWIRSPGPFAGPLGVLGILHAIGLFRRTSRPALDPLWVLMLLVLPVAAALRAFVGEWEPGYLVATLPMVQFFFCSGLCLAIRVTGAPVRVTAPCVTLLAAASAIANVTSTPPKLHVGMDAVARSVAASPVNQRYLIVSDPKGEGIFIAEVAAAEQRPGHVIERGSKTLSRSNWLGRGYVLLFPATEDLMRYFESDPGRILILDDPDSQSPDAALVERTVAAYPDRWRLIAQYPRIHSAGRAPGEVRILRLSYPKE